MKIPKAVHSVTQLVKKNEKIKEFHSNQVVSLSIHVRFICQFKK